jgi:hypothetical protein
MKKRILAFCLCLGMLFGFTGCSQSKLDRFSDHEALLLVNGEVVMTALDFRRLTIQQAVSHDIKETEELSEKELFIQQAQITLLSYFATEYGLSYDRSVLEEEYDAHMLEIQDTDLYGNELLFATTLQVHWEWTVLHFVPGVLMNPSKIIILMPYWKIWLCYIHISQTKKF